IESFPPRVGGWTGHRKFSWCAGTVCSLSGCPRVSWQMAGRGVETLAPFLELCRCRYNTRKYQISGFSASAFSAHALGWERRFLIGSGRTILSVDERNRLQTGVPLPGLGTVMIDPKGPNDEFSTLPARQEEVWKPTVFISYSKSNLAQRKRLESELKILQRRPAATPLARPHDRPRRRVGPNHPT
ncbi:MAG: hypothetical protein JWR15_2514, partial [Prosthecobacter sp.]|nr:hypothetical protein [Prosthecobacter sp.]